MIHKRLFSENKDQGITRYWHENAVDEKAAWKGEWHLVASIPESLYYKMKAEGKIDDQEYMKRWLNDSDNQFFRTRPGKV
jgi:hypothetical protein